MNCEYCDVEIPEDEECWQTDADGKEILICTSCFYNNYSECCLCCGYVPDEEMGALGNILCCVDSEAAELPLGLYEVIKHPYYFSNHFSEGLFIDSVRYLGEKPLSVDTNGAPIGCVCTECSKNIKEEIACNSRCLK